MFENIFRTIRPILIKLITYFLQSSNIVTQNFQLPWSSGNGQNKSSTKYLKLFDRFSLNFQVTFRNRKTVWHKFSISSGLVARIKINVLQYFQNYLTDFYQLTFPIMKYCDKIFIYCDLMLTMKIKVLQYLQNYFTDFHQTYSLLFPVIR